MILRSHDLLGDCLFDVLRSATVGRMLYCLPAWWGFTDAQERRSLEGIIRKLVRLGYLPLSASTFEVLCNKADSKLCLCILTSTCRVLHQSINQSKFADIYEYKLRL